MESLFFYLIKASASLILFYSMYWFLLREGTLFNANRIFLLAGILISLVLPLADIHYNITVSSQNTSNVFVKFDRTFQTFSAVDKTAGFQSNNFSWINIFFIIYILGVATLFVRLIWQNVTLNNLTIKNKCYILNGVKIIENDRYELPFSYFNMVFVNPKHLNKSDLISILSHEKVHIREKHWVDLLIVELITVFFWFNPFAWFFERSVKQNHEYLADKGVLAQGLSVGRYQSILINLLMGTQIIGITNNLNYSLNQKRMKMMTTNKTSKSQALRMLWALPVISVLLVAFAKPNYVVNTQQVPQNSNVKDSTEQQIQFTGRVVDGTGSPLNDASIVIYGSTVGTISDSEGFFTLTADKSDQIIISYVGYITQRVSLSEIEYKLEKNNNKPITFVLEVGTIKLDLDKIIREGKLAEEETAVDDQSENNKFFIIIEDIPKYPGGLYNFAVEIKDMVKKHNPQGRVDIDFRVNVDGSMTPLYVNHSSKSADIVSELLTKFNNWTPGIQRGKAVPVNFSVTMNFD